MQVRVILIFHINFYPLQMAIRVKSNLLHNDNNQPVDNSSPGICMAIPILVYCKYYNYGMPENDMKTLAQLQKEAGEIQLTIRRLLLNNYSYDDGIFDQLTKIATITDLRKKFITLDREIKLRTDSGQ